MFKKELEYFKKHQDELVNQYNGKYLAIKGEEIIGVYSDPIIAYTNSIKDHKPGSFMIQPCVPGPEAFTVTISTSELIKV